MPPLKKILVIQTAFIGDAILGTGVLEALHAAHPEAELHYLVRQGNEGLFQEHPYLTKVWVWVKKEDKYRNLLRTANAVRKEKFDLVVNLQRFLPSGLITALSGADHTVGFKKNPLSRFFTYAYPHQIGKKGAPYLHEVERNHLLLRHFLPDGTPAAKPRLYPSERQIGKVKAFTQQPFVTIAPASVWFTKQWPEEKWVELINALPQNQKVYLLGGPADAEMCQRIQQAAHHPGVEILAGKLSLLETAALMPLAQMNYVNDSAPMHLASSTNAPVTAVYCSTIPEFGFGPLSDNSKVAEYPGDLYCRPCGLHGYRQCPEGHFRCAKEINIEQVL